MDTLKELLPNIYEKLLKGKNILEHSYKDAMEFEFVIQKSKLYILQYRQAKRTAKANIKICLDLLVEGIITPDEVLQRITYQGLISYLAPLVENSSELKYFISGLPTYNTSSTGALIFNKMDMKLKGNNRKHYILVKEEINPDDINYINKLSGIITKRGGLTSHASLISRTFQIPCIVGCSNIKISNNFIENEFGERINKGEYLTMDNNAGCVYKGVGTISNPNWKKDIYMKSLLQIVKFAIETNNLPYGYIGEIWNIWDYFNHSILLKPNLFGKQPVTAPLRYTSFTQPQHDIIVNYWNSLSDIKESDEYEYTNCILGLKRTLIRNLSNIVGIGNHFEYYRPLIDPMLSIMNDMPGLPDNVSHQLVVEEFSNISNFLPNYPDIEKITIFYDNVCLDDSQLCFLDYTNVDGESLVDRTFKIKRFIFMVNDAIISYDALPLFYHILRKREYQFFNH